MSHCDPQAVFFLKTQTATVIDWLILVTEARDIGEYLSLSKTCPDCDDYGEY